MRVYRIRTWCRDCGRGRTDNHRGGGGGGGGGSGGGGGGGVLPPGSPCHRWGVNAARMIGFFF